MRARLPLHIILDPHRGFPMSAPIEAGYASFSDRDVAVVTPLNNFLGPEGDTVTADKHY